MKQIVVLGAGQLGATLQGLMPQSIHLLDHSALDICDHAAVERTLTDLRPSIVINAAAYNRVDDAESQADLAFAVNAIAVGVLARTATAIGARLAHVSTDYVFSGELTRPYREDDLPAPLSVYGASKLAGEHLAFAYQPDALVLRTSSVFGRPMPGAHTTKGNFVEAILRQARTATELQVVADQLMGPTYAVDLAQAMLTLLGQEARGLVHVSNSGACTWQQFAASILEVAGYSTPIIPVTSAQRPSPARRPRYSVLDHQRLNAYGISLPPWQDALTRYLAAGMTTIQRRENGE